MRALLPASLQRQSKKLNMKSIGKQSQADSSNPRRMTLLSRRRLLLVFIFGYMFPTWWVVTHLNINLTRTVGEPVDELNGVAVYYNGGVGHTEGRHLTADGYNLGLKYQCVEFVKRYYFEHLNHRMPDTYGHARDFFDPALSEGVRNPQRALIQYRNGGSSKPKPDDLMVFGPTLLNPYGHVAIVSHVSDTRVEIIQQNPGPFGSSREQLTLVSQNGGWLCGSTRILGWLRKL